MKTCPNCGKHLDERSTEDHYDYRDNRYSCSREDEAVRSSALVEPLTVTLRAQGGWWTAICIELDVSGMGSGPLEAMEAVGRSIYSTLRARERKRLNS